MVIGRVSVLAVAVAVAVWVGSAFGASAEAQPSYDTLRIEQGGTAAPYLVWVAWSPLLLTTPDGGAWAFFSAQAVQGETMGTRKLYASRFDPAAGTWSPATAVPGGDIQFAPAGVVDPDGTVHLVYTDRPTGEEGQFGSLHYLRIAPDGTMSSPVPVAPDPNAGHQLSPSLARDADGRLHLVWQDQREMTPEVRQASATNADVFGCDLSAEGTCGPIVRINARQTPEANASRPQVVVDGNRLVAVWSIYEGTTEEALASATRIEWSIRPLGDPNAAWTPAQTLLERGDALIGGRLVDIASAPNGGVVMIFGRRTDQNALYLTRLEAGGGRWTQPVLLTAGASGSFPTLAVGPDGTSYVTYNIGSGTAVQVGAVALAPDEERAGVETVLSLGEDGAQGRPVVDVDASGRVWVLYLHEPVGGPANEVRTLRGARIPSEPAPEAVASPEASPAPVASPAP